LIIFFHPTLLKVFICSFNVEMEGPKNIYDIKHDYLHAFS